VYSVWYFDGWGLAAWFFGVKEDIGTAIRAVAVYSLAASPESINNDSCWTLCAGVSGVSHVTEASMRGITTTALNADALAAAKLTANITFDNAIEQAAPSFVLSSLGSTGVYERFMGVYERQDEREQVHHRFVYKGPNDHWAWYSDRSGGWLFGREEEGIGKNKASICVFSSAPTPESIITKRWYMADDEDAELQQANLTITAIHYKPAELFKGTCMNCVQCREWRRCGKGSNAMYCSEACQRAHLQQAGHDEVCPK
jgi:hypothetical protein